MSGLAYALLGALVMLVLDFAVHWYVALLDRRSEIITTGAPHGLSKGQLVRDPDGQAGVVYRVREVVDPRTVRVKRLR